MSVEISPEPKLKEIVDLLTSLENEALIKAQRLVEDEILRRRVEC